MSKNYSIFISHSWTYSETLEALRDLINGRDGFVATYEESTRDKPINSEDEEYVKRRLRDRILSSDIVLGIAGIYASHSDWIRWELDTAQKNGIPIVGVVPRGQERLSAVVTERSIEVVRWNGDSIISAIRRHAKK